jgi:hypothetical protein
MASFGYLSVVIISNKAIYNSELKECPPAIELGGPGG